MAPEWRHAYARRMGTIQIKHVPESTHAVLSRRAAEAGKSLQEYMLALINEHASRPTMAEAIARIEQDLADHPPRSHVTLAEIREVIEDERARR